jgi:hypothetical protein
MMHKDSIPYIESIHIPAALAKVSPGTPSKVIPGQISIVFNRGRPAVFRRHPKMQQSIFNTVPQYL